MLEMIKNLLTSPISTSQQNIGRASRFATFQLKLWYHCTKLLQQNRIRQQAAALSYYTIFGIIPLAIVILLIFQSFPAFTELGDKVKTFIYNQAHLTGFQNPDAAAVGKENAATLTTYLDALVARFFAGTNTGAVTIFSIISVIIAAISLLSTIEKTFNNIWGVTKSRPILQQTINYWALLTLGPLLMGAAIYVTTFSFFHSIQKTVSTTMTPAIISYFITVVAFFLLYLLMPNTKVKIKPALWGAAVASLAWIIAKYGFNYCITGLKIYNTVYGMLALIPMTVVWIYITWLIVIFGVQLTYTTQNLKSLDDAAIAASHRNEQYFIAGDMAVINIVREIALAFQKNNAPVDQQTICSQSNLPYDFCDKILNQLVAKGILAKTTDPRIGFLPARNPANIKLSEITEALSSIGFTLPANAQSQLLVQLSESHEKNLSNYTVQQLVSNQ
jgi:membrane protein